MDAIDRPTAADREELTAELVQLRQRVAILETLLVEVHDQEAARAGGHERAGPPA